MLEVEKKVVMGRNPHWQTGVPVAEDCYALSDAMDEAAIQSPDVMTKSSGFTARIEHGAY